MDDQCGDERRSDELCAGAAGRVGCGEPAVRSDHAGRDSLPIWIRSGRQACTEPGYGGVLVLGVVGVCGVRYRRAAARDGGLYLLVGAAGWRGVPSGAELCGELAERVFWREDGGVARQGGGGGPTGERAGEFEWGDVRVLP